MIGHARVLVADASAQPGLAWAEGGVFTVPEALAADPAFMSPAKGGVRLPPPAPEARPRALAAAAALRAAHMYAARKPMSSRLPFSYQRVPQWARTLAAKAIGRAQRGRSASWADFPAWPLDLSADFLAGLGGQRGPFAGKPAPVLLSHDLDSEEGLDNALARFLPLEEAFGARSTNFLVPAAWRLDHGKLRELTGRGHGLGVHGFDHSNLTAYSEPETLRRRLAAGRELLRDYGVEGYRAPSLVRTPELLQGLRGLYRYDSSIPTSGGPFPVPDNGCASARPFVPDGRPDGLWEIPLSLPRDGSLLFLGHSPREILALWKRCAQAIAASGGVVVLLTHCERRMSGQPAMLAAYEAFLEHLAACPDYQWSSPGQVLDALGQPGARP